MSLRNALFVVTCCALASVGLHQAYLSNQEKRRLEQEKRLLEQNERVSEIISALVAIRAGIRNRWESHLDHNMDARKFLEDGPEHPTGRDSWRFRLLAFMEHVPADDFDTPWSKGRFAHYAHWVYCLTRHCNSEGFYTTNCLAIVGPGSLAGSALSNYEADAIVIVAVGDTDIAWGMSGDLRLDEQGNLVDDWPGPIDDKWIGVLFGDGRAWLLDKSVPLEKLALFFTVEKAKKHNADKILGPYVLTRSSIGIR